MSKQKKRSAGDIIRGIIFLIAVGVFIYSAYQLIAIRNEYKKGDDEYKELEQYVKIQEPESKENAETQEPINEDEKYYPPQPSVDFQSLTNINEDVIGWIDMRAIDISYPIVQAEDNDYYLHRTVEKTYNFAGSIFLDYMSNKAFTDCNTLLYGHNMKNGSMFGKLKKYREQAVYDSDPYFWICTPDESYVYKIFSVYETPVNSSTYTFFSANGTEFEGWIKEMQGKSEVTNDIEVSQEDKILTLSTCTSDRTTRCIVQAKQVKKVKNN